MKHRMNTSGNTRRRLVVAMGATAFTAPISTFAQQPKIWRVGFLAPRPIGPLESDFFGAFQIGRAHV